MTIPFDMKRLHHGCGESLKIKPCVLLHLARQIEPVTTPSNSAVCHDVDLWQSTQTRQLLQRLWG